MLPKNRLVAKGRGSHFSVMIPFLIAGGSVLTTLVAPEPVDTMNHTLLGVKVKAKEVVTRNAWGTPMMPNGKGSYSLIAPPDPVLIERSLIQPPKTEAPTYHPDKRYPLASLPEKPAVKEPSVEPSVPVVVEPEADAAHAVEEPAVVEEPAAETSVEAHTEGSGESPSAASSEAPTP